MNANICTTHHYACTCREAHFAVMAEEIKKLQRERDQLLGLLSDVEVITKTHRNAIRQVRLVERIEAALDSDTEESCRN